jgi:hypothetical protein
MDGVDCFVRFSGEPMFFGVVTQVQLAGDNSATLRGWAKTSPQAA